MLGCDTRELANGASRFLSDKHSHSVQRFCRWITDSKYLGSSFWSCPALARQLALDPLSVNKRIGAVKTFCRLPLERQEWFSC